MTRRRETGRVFRVRTAGVAIRDGCVLVHREEQPSPWTNSALPGGGVEMHETSDAALVREFREELGVDVRVGRLLWVADNRFVQSGERWQEIGFYWEVLVDASLASAGGETTRESDTFFGGEARLQWAWHPLGRLSEIDLKPSFLVEGLRDLPKSTRFLVHGDAEIPTGP